MLQRGLGVEGWRATPGPDTLPAPPVRVGQHTSRPHDAHGGKVAAVPLTYNWPINDYVPVSLFLFTCMPSSVFSPVFRTAAACPCPCLPPYPAVFLHSILPSSVPFQVIDASRLLILSTNSGGIVIMFSLFLQVGRNILDAGGEVKGSCSSSSSSSFSNQTVPRTTYYIT